MRGPLTLIRDAFIHLRQHFTLFLGIYILPMIAVSLFGIAAESITADGSTLPSVGAIITIVLSAVVFAVVSLCASLGLILAIYQPLTTTVRSAYAYAIRNIFPFLILTLLVGLATTVGFILLIIPGIIVMVWFAFSQFFFVTESLRGTAAMRASRELVRGNWWAVFGRMAAMMAAILLVFIPVGTFVAMALPVHTLVQEFIINVVSLVLAPVFVAYVYFMYVDLKKSKTEGSEASETDAAAQDDTAAKPLSAADATN